MVTQAVFIDCLPTDGRASHRRCRRRRRRQLLLRRRSLQPRAPRASSCRLLATAGSGSWGPSGPDGGSGGLGAQEVHGHHHRVEVVAALTTERIRPQTRHQLQPRRQFRDAVDDWGRGPEPTRSYGTRGYQCWGGSGRRCCRSGRVLLQLKQRRTGQRPRSISGAAPQPRATCRCRLTAGCARRRSHGLPRAPRPTSPTPPAARLPAP